MIKLPLRAGWITAALTMLLPRAGHAQIRASERASVSQTIDGTTFTIDYARPRARGRSAAALFGKEVAWEEVWTPGANDATSLRVNRDFFIDGHAVPAGKYSVWMQVKQTGDWIFALDNDTTRFHTRRPRVDSTRLHFPVKPQSTPFTEVLTWSVPAMSHDAARLEMAWSNITVPLQIRVKPKLQRTMAAADAAPYIGDYAIEWLWGSKPDSGIATIRYNAADSTLRLLSRTKSDTMPLILTTVTSGVFVPLFMMEGQIGESSESMMFEFVRKDDAAISFDVRDKGSDKIQARAKRNPGAIKPL